MEAMISLSLRLLGAFAVSLDGQSVETFATDKERALLAYLAVEADRPHRRDELSTLLWPDLPAEKARNNFRVTLHRLRQAVHHPDTETIQATREIVGINPDVEVQVDVILLAQKLEEVRQHNDQNQLCQACHGRLTGAVKLYGGEFLAGFILDGGQAFNEWARLKRQWVHLRVLDALDRLAQYHQRRGEVEPAQKYAFRQIELEPWREKAHRQLMRNLACAGEYNAAVAQFEACRQILSEELGIEPAEKTVRLYEDILVARETHFRSLPNVPGPLIGREEELAQCVERLADPDCRLLALVGPGGVGKSRLALEVAREQTPAFLHGVCYVPLTPVDSPDRLLGAIARAVNYRFQYRRDRRSELLGYLENKEILLVLDHFEHLVAERDLLPALVVQAPGLKVLVTSRVRLNLKGEEVFELQGLDVPEQEGPTDVEQYGAVRLFMEKARKANPSFELSPQARASVLQLCRFVSGVPLGIELAASWLRVLTPQETLARMRQSLDFLEAPASDVPDRHRSMRASFEHSWVLLGDDGREALMKLSIFRGGFTVEAAEEVAGASLDTLTSLVDRSLLWHDVPAGRLDRHELLRQFAGDKLDQAGQAAAIRDAHGAYYLSLLCRLGGDVKGGEQQIEALETIDADIENVRAAWGWALENRAYERLQEAIDVLARVCIYNSRYKEGEQLFRWAARVLESRSDEGSKRLLGPITARRAEFASGYLRYGEAICLLEHSLEMARHAGAQAEIAYSLQAMGRALLNRDGPRRARSVLEESLELASAIDTRQIQRRALVGLHNSAMLEGKHGEAIRLAQEVLALCRETGDNIGLSDVLYSLGVSKCYVGWFEEGKHHLEESLAIRQQLEDRDRISSSQGALALYATRAEGNYEEARALAEQSLAMGRSIYDPHSMSISLVALSDVACWQERYAEAARRAEESLQITAERGAGDLVLFGRDALALALWGLGAYQDAKEQICAALNLSLRHNAKALVLAHLASMALVLAQEGEDERAIELFALARSHPARLRAWLERLPLYARLRTELEARVPAEIFARAWGKGKELDLEEVVTRVISEKCVA